MTAIKFPSFASGELTPSLYARTDIARYLTGLRTCRNHFVKRQGGVDNRSGTSFIAEVKDSSKTVRMIPFIFNSEQTYILEFGDQYIRFYRNAAQIEVSAVTAWSAATSYVVGDLASRLGVNYYCILANTNQQPPNSTYWYPLTGDIYEIPTPFLEADLPALQFVQSADVIFIVHPSYAPRQLSRTAHTNWTLTTMSFGASSNPIFSLQTTGSAGSLWSYKATCVDADTFEESVVSSFVATTGTNPTASAGISISAGLFTPNNVREVRFYKGRVGNFHGFIGSAIVDPAFVSIFRDFGIEPDYTDLPPEDLGFFASADDYPAAISYYQQRLFLGGSNNEPETIYGSKIGLTRNFTYDPPVNDDGFIRFSILGTRVNRIKQMIGLSKLIVMSSEGEWSIEGNDASTITPLAINARQHSYNGSGDLRPIVINGNALYVQGRGSIIRDLFFNFDTDAYAGNDLTIFSSHLFDGYSLVDWDFQKTPHSIVWAVRNDGVLLGLTYIREQQMVAWHRHDFHNGTVENVCVIPEGNEDSVYFVVKRSINGSDVRYVEKMESRLITDILDAHFVDCALTYDGRNTTATTMTLSGGTAWTNPELLTLTASASYFVIGDIGNAIHLTGDDGTIIRFSIEGFTSDLIVTGRAHKTVPSNMRNVAISEWAKAVDEISGLNHLEGQNVSVFADGFVVANPNNSRYSIKTVSGGSLTLDRPYAVIKIGLPIIADLETLDLDNPNGETLSDKKKLITNVGLYVESSRGIWAGGAPPTDDNSDPLEDLTEFKLRNLENYDQPTELKTEFVDVNIKGEWNSNGRVFIRQIDPLPLSILAVVPSGLAPFGR